MIASLGGLFEQPILLLPIGNRTFSGYLLNLFRISSVISVVITCCFFGSKGKVTRNSIQLPACVRSKLTNRVD